MLPSAFRSSSALALVLCLSALTLPSAAFAQTAPPPAPGDAPAPSATQEPLPPPEPAPTSSPAPIAPPDEPAPAPIVAPPPPAEAEDEVPRMSEGRAIVVAWNTGFQWGIAPGVVFASGRAGFSLGVRLGYGIDTGTVIVVPGVRLSATFLDPNIYQGMPVGKLVLPIDRFAPFVEGGAGLGHIAGSGSPSATGAALYVGGGFMIHFTRSFALGAEASYQTITGTGFKGFGVGPIIAFAF